MINKLNNIEDLKVERIRLQQKRLALEEAMRNDFAQIKQSLEPRNIIRNGIGGIIGNSSAINNDLLGTSLTMGINFLVSKVLMRRSGIIKKLIFTWLIKKYGIDFFEKNSDTIINAVKKIINKYAHKESKSHPNHIYDSGTVAEDY